MTVRLRNRSGVALVATLWLVVAIASLTFAVAASARSRRLAAANAAEAVQARAAADAGVEHALARLHRMLDDPAVGRAASAAALDPWRGSPSASLDTTALEAARYVATVAPVGDRLHLNQASEDDLRRLLRGLRIDDARADETAQRILDWRDPDDVPRRRGAEAEQYRGAATPHLPGNRDFADVAELSRVLGMAPALVAALTPHVTVAGSGSIDLNGAPRPVLLALPGMTEPAADVVLRVRRSGRRLANLQELRALLPAAARPSFDQRMAELLPRVAFDTREVEIHAIGWVDGSPVRAESRAVVARAGTAALPVWRRTSIW